MLDVEKLKYLRLVFNLSQEELSARLGVTKPYVSMIENRKQPLPENLYQKWIDSLYGQYDFRETEEGKLKQQEKEQKSNKKIQNLK